MRIDLFRSRRARRTTLGLRSPRDRADEPTVGHLAPRPDRAILLAARGLLPCLLP